MMKKSFKFPALIVIIISLLASGAFALDYPHYDINNIGCDSCHFIYGSQPSLLPPWTVHTPIDIDDMPFNTLCWSCHNDIEAPFVRTHSSLQIDNGYGDWTIECRVCHNPHYQQQFRVYGSASYLYSGAVTGVTSSTITMTGAGWTVDQYKDRVVFPNVLQKNYSYKIIGNTSDTLTVKGPVNLTKVITGDTFAIIYGKLIKETIVTPNSGSRATRLFRSSGAKSFADGDSVYDGVCEVCHTKTTYHRNNPAADHAHNTGTKCTSCHFHSEGFKGSCTGCHGSPPVDLSTLVFNPGPTGSLTAGAHDLHANIKGLGCSVCHYNSAGAGATHNSGSVTIGFYTFNGTYQGGVYNGQAGVNYNATTTSPATTVTSEGTATCSNIYCHSSGQSSSNGNSAVPVYASPKWDNPASGSCGTCHRVTEASGLTSGSHGQHLGTTGVNGCGDCHTGAADNASSYNSASHINGSINVSNTYSAAGAPGNGYGTCSTAPCHDSGTGTPALTPVWGADVPACTACHAEIPATGSHQKHIVTTGFNKALCRDCHNGAVQGTVPPVQHLDTNIDVYYSAPGDLGYPQNKAKGSAYASCSTAYCHSTGQSVTNGNSAIPSYSTPQWGNPASGACGTCHKVTETSGLTSGSHARHLGTVGVSGCGDCHIGAANNASSYNSITHIDGIIDVANTYSAGGPPGNGYGSCSTASCHDNGTGSPALTPVWGTSAPACTACHSLIPATGSHQKHVVTTAYKKAVCGDCHDGAVQGLTPPEQHLDTNIDVYDVSPGDLGYPQNKAKSSLYTSCSTAYCHSTGQSTSNGNSATPTYSTPSWGDSASGACGTCHKISAASGLTSGSHAVHLNASGVNGCGDCHTGAANNASSYNSLNHVNKQIDVANTYSAAGSPGNDYGTCSTASCHTNVQTDGGGPGSLVPTPVWGSSIACGECHQAVPTTGKHTVHLVNAGAVCGDCHNGAGNGSSIPPANHINGSINVGSGSTQIGSYSSPGIGDGYGTCSNITCHGNNNANWAASTSTVTLDCSNCHGGTLDADDFIYLNGTASKVNMSQWYSTGHGGIQTPLACTTCHTASVPHGTENNFFRLGNGVRDICTVCHKGMTEHFGYRHNEQNGLNGGSLCWDCHDPHGDTSIKMVHDKPWLSHDSSLRPVKVADTVVTFSANSAWNDFVKPGPDYNGVCQVCHESSTNIQHFYRYDTYPNAAGSYDTNHNPGAVCTTCHQHNDFQPTACNGCHGQSGETGAPLIVSDLVTKSGRGVGAHQKHVIEKGYTDCTLCHSGYIMPQVVPEMTITFTGLGAGGTYDGMAFTGSDINWSYDPAWPTTTGTRDCSNLYCHGNFSGSGKNATPSWDILSSGACGTCHGQSNFDPPMSGKHVRHADSYKFECYLCHKGVVDLDRVFYGMNYFKVIDNVKHVNGVVDWAFDLTDPRFPAGAAYSIPSGTAVPTDGTTPRASGNCSNIYCHSIVQTSAGGVLTSGTSDYKSPSWSNNSNWLGCNGCHENKDGNHGYAGNGLKSGSHASHLQYNFTTGNSDRLICAVCHKTGPNGFYSNTCGACHTGFPTLSHADGKIDVIMASEVVGNSAAYHGTPQPADGFSNCTNVYCHSTGQSVTDGNSAVPVYTVPTWGSLSSGACGTCHRVSESSGLTSGSHAEHLGSTGVNGCGDCHQGASNDGSSYNDYVTHVNKSIDVLNDYTAGGAPGNGYGTCSAASCHTTVQADGGTPGTLKTTPVWGTATACGECHEAVPVTGRHTVHLINANATCGNCHPGAGNGSAIPAANHINGVINIGGTSTEIGSYSSPGIGDGYGTCSSISCHGGNNAVWVKKTEPAGLDCADCHGGASDVDDFNYLNGTTAKISMSEWSAKGHGSKSLSCTSCHDTAVPHGDGNNFYRLKGGNSTICQTCHTNLTQHYGDRHSTAYNGGSFCFDCHDPHGDASVKMIHDRPWLSHDASGKPTKVADTSVSFTGNQGWSDFVTSGFNGVCQICHESATGIKHFYRYSTYPTVDGSYNTNHNQGFACTQCHKHNDFQPAGGCTICHSVSQGDRAAVVGQLSSGNSHHIQGVEVKDEHCYQCHWEANSDGSINITYHGGWDSPGSVINLVVYGTGARPAAYGAVTAVEYMANGSRTEMSKINTVCLGCHSAKNSTAKPFGDGKTPQQYAWDGRSVDERYSQTATTPWGKYTNTSGTNFTPKNTQTKAYSAHGNAAANQRGWNLSETWPNTSGSVQVLCFDCHNSHGSSVSGKTSSYTSATANGAILKDTTGGKGGYVMTYKPQAGGSAAENNAHNAGAGICFDCHVTQNAGITPWGYQGTFGSSQAILGYFDTMWFGPGLAGSQQRYAYKAQNVQAKKGHFGVSASLSMPVNGTIGGLCTPCHDPHGVSPSLGINQQYSMPLLKGTWMTSPYKEDITPGVTSECRGIKGESANQPAYCGSSTPGYRIDQNTFASWNYTSAASISQSVNEFGGLCLQCHPKSSLSPDTTSQWRSVDRIHNSVKGWDNDGNTMHRFTCSKCHTPHNAALGRLLITNCLDPAHRGRIATDGYPGNGSYQEGSLGSSEGGRGSGRFPAGGGGSGEDGKRVFAYFFGTTAGTRACHENENSDGFPSNQKWNNVSPWGTLGSGGGTGGGTCSSISNKDTCEHTSGCEWRDNQCRVK